MSAIEVIESTLHRIRTLDTTVHAFCTVDEEGALAHAAEVDRRLANGEPVGPLAGVPVGIKDLICTKDIRTTGGSALYADFVPDEDDVVVERLRAADAIVIGKTNAAEFGYGAVGHNNLFPTTRNPWDTELTSGGSSAGSAAAVAAGLVPLALGTDGGGSIRIPASLCGVFGMKPSWGRVPLHPGCRDARLPGLSGWESLEHIGPLTRTASDAAVALSVLSGPSVRDRFSIPADPGQWEIEARVESLKGSRIAFDTDLDGTAVDREVLDAVENAMIRIQGLIPAIDRSHPAMTVGNEETFEAIVAMETDRSGLRARAEDLGISIGGWLGEIIGRTWTAEEFTSALMERKRIVDTTWRFMEDYDFFITPTTAVPAFPIDTYGPETIDGRPLPRSGWTPFSTLANFTGLPAASVPLGFTEAGLPIGLQIMGRHLDDQGVLALATLVESLYPRTKEPEVR